jgi:hypothetical protein
MFASSSPPPQAPLSASALQLSQRTHLSPLAIRGKGARKTPKKRSVPDGKTVSKMFNPVASRPQPALTSLEQGIMVTLDYSTAFLVSSITVPVQASVAFTVSLFAQSANYLALFDQYKIDQIECWLEPQNLNTAVTTVPLASCVDLDDANSTVFTSVESKQGSIVSTTLNGHYHKWKPHVAIAEYSGAFTSFGNAPAAWIDAASPNVQHYGMKAATAGSDGVARTVLLTARALVSFRTSAI